MKKLTRKQIIKGAIATFSTIVAIGTDLAISAIVKTSTTGMKKWEKAIVAVATATCSCAIGDYLTKYVGDQIVEIGNAVKEAMEEAKCQS